MIIAVGHDLVEISRIRALTEREPQRWQKLFAPPELAYCAAHADPAPSLAARFAAKEAFQKVWPQPHGWQDVWVERQATPAGPFPFTAPRLAFSPALAAQLAEQGLRTHLSLTHTTEHASAVVILEQP